MSFTYVVLGAGRQGVAIAYDLARNGDAARVVLADVDPAVAQRAVERLERLLPEAAGRFTHAACDVADAAAVRRLLEGADVAVSAAPYRFNVGLTDAAIAAGCSLCDLGGNTGVVREQLARHEAASSAGVSIVPDCGLAPGLGNHLAAHGVAALDEPRDVHVRCGGLPQRPVGPLGYKLLFHFQGLINEYSGAGEFLREGKLVQVPALTELEPITFDLARGGGATGAAATGAARTGVLEATGALEAAVTSGGTSTCPQTFLGRLRTYDYKTVRYPGHFAIIRALFELGCFEDRVRLRDGSEIAPRPVVQRLMEERLAFPDVRDVVVLRVTVAGSHGGRPTELRYDLVDWHDEATGFSAMERTTGFPTALVAHMQARKLVARGARPLELSVPPVPFLAELPRHDIHVKLARGGG